jgi:UDP-N-acetylglucosamine 2-epimerase
LKPSFIKFSPSELDAFAWKAICDWPKYGQVDVVHKGLDYSHLTRWFLWDKVARALRRQSNPRAAAFESEMLLEKGNLHPAVSPAAGGSAQKGSVRQRLGSLFPLKKTRPVSPLENFRRRHESLLYVPVISDRLKKSIVDLAGRKTCQLATRTPDSGLEGVDLFHPPPHPKADEVVAERLYKGILAGLGDSGIVLEETDSAQLHRQISELTALVKRVEQELEILKPDALLVHGDNHPPFQAYVLAARKMGIPSIMLQHGLDCEHYYLDEAYASAIALWGPERQRRYRERSEWQPETRVTGNPEFDHFLPPRKLYSGGDYWLWTTRPHAPEKCYAPSRHPREGLRIFTTLVDVLRSHPEARLVVKPHPYDYADLYLREAERVGMRDRIRISYQEVRKLIPYASLVISEDSTAGMEAMLWGKPLVHAHFAESPPTMPFVALGAALPGFSPEELTASVNHANDLTSSDKQCLFAGQVAFLAEFAGPVDGQAGKRVAEFITEIVRERTWAQA